MCSIGLGGFLCEFGFTLGVMIYDDWSCDCDGGSLSIPYKNIGEAGTG